MMSNVIGYPVSAAKKTFIPYFQYKIDAYQRDYYLYFTTSPNSIRYANDIFNKLNEYDGFEIIQYVEFHYTACDDKADFLRFLKYETNRRLKLKTGEPFKVRLGSVSEWLSEKQEQQQALHQQEVKLQFEQEAYKIIKKELDKGNIANDNPDNIASQS